MNEQTTSRALVKTAMAQQRQRPRWARAIHYLGEDLRWALSAWCDFPRPVTRLTAAAVSAFGAFAFGLDDSLHGLLALFTD